MSTKFTVSLAQKLSGRDAVQIQRLDASNKQLSDVADLSECEQLVKLDLSRNSLTKLGAVVQCTTLTWLDVSNNLLDSLVGLQRLINLSVLRASHNSLTICGDLSRLKNLKALILGHNQLSYIPGLSSLSQLNTLVLSHNQFESVHVEKLTRLSKLSLSDNQLKAIPNTQNNLELRELRLNGNKIKKLPETLLESNRKLRILDLGRNKLKDISALEPLKCIDHLVNLNLKGNKLCDDCNYTQMVLSLQPNLQILDSTKVERLSLASNKDVTTTKKKSSKNLHSQSVESTVGSHERKRKNRTEKLGEDTEHNDEIIAEPIVKKRKRTPRPQEVVVDSTENENGSESKDSNIELASSVVGLPTSRDKEACDEHSIDADDGVKVSLKKSLSRRRPDGRRSGVVAVKEVQKQKKKESKQRDWNHYLDDDDHYHQVGIGHSSTWT